MKREENFEKIVTQSKMEAQLSAFVAIPFIAIAIGLTYVIHGSECFKGNDNIWTIVAAIAALLSIYPHELLHAFGWMKAGNKEFDEMKIELHFPMGANIGFQGDMKVESFIIGAILPFLVTAVIPVAVGIVIGNFQLLFYGSLMAMSCGSDLVLAWAALEHRGRRCYDPGVTGFGIRD